MLLMQMSELDYDLPPAAIAVKPAEPRDHSRLLVTHRGDGPGAGGVDHRWFYDLPLFLRPGDLLITNSTRVLPARLSLRRQSGANIPGLFVAEKTSGVWEVLLRTRGKVREGEDLVGGAYQFRLARRIGEGRWEVQVTPAAPAAVVLDAVGAMPVPPYIERERKAVAPADAWEVADRAWYQTVFARGEGRSVAAPTAGLHFTPELLAAIDGLGVRRAEVELEVGLGTFLPVETETLEEHRMHRERYRVPAATVAAIRALRAGGRGPGGAGGRLVAVGTTAVRTLETVAGAILEGDTPPTELAGETDLKIGPGYSFRLVEALVTNFHLPRSTLMALVGAFLGAEGVGRLKACYQDAIGRGYRFYSYGDAMLILP
jgi:S-adenosylmethionine:tRNA ribosyltransferase-isomerase